MEGGMKVSVISVGKVKPSSSSVHELEPFKLSLIDQLHYMPLIFFYQPTKCSTKFPTHQQITLTLKTSLSQTLNLFYPCAGRLQEGALTVHDFHKGAKFIDARVVDQTLTLSDSLKHPPTFELYESLLPLNPFTFAATGGHEDMPLVSVQTTSFGCGGIAIGTCFNHKIMDAASVGHFIKTWTAIAADRDAVVVPPSLLEASSRFPPMETLPLVPVKSPKVGTEVNRRFVFEAEKIASLKNRARAVSENPSRFETLSAFIAKRAASANGGKVKEVKVSIAVNIRRRLNPPMSDNSIGNIAFVALTRAVAAAEEAEMNELVRIIREEVRKVGAELGDGGGGSEDAVIRRLGRKSAEEEETTLAVTFSSLTRFGFGDVDFGWGKPVWTSIAGGRDREQRPATGNLVVLKDSGDAVEAWMNFDAEMMDMLERDPEFLEFATPNPPILF